MAGRNFSTMRYFDIRCAEMEPLFAFDASNEHEVRRWRTRAMAKVRDLLGEMPGSVQLEAEIVDRVDRGSFTQEKIIFDSDLYSSVPAYMLIPKNIQQPAPTILCLHGHGPGKDAVAGITNADEFYNEQEKQNIITQHNYDYARQFAEQGYITFTFDFRCFGERIDSSTPLHDRDRCNVQFMRGSLLGINLLALNIHDSMRALDYIESRQEVDAKRIGCMGLSLGGIMTLWTTALDKRIKTAVISGCFGEFEHFAINRANFCGLQFVHALRRYFDLSDIAALIAPRPLLIENGVRDNGYPIDSAKRAYKHLELAYGSWAKPECVMHDIFDGGNEFDSKTAAKWIKQWL